MKTTSNKLSFVFLLSFVIASSYCHGADGLGFKAVSAGGSFTASHSLFLRHDGEVWAAGSNLTGAVGDGTGYARPATTLIMTDVASISAGPLHSLFLKKDSSVWAVGWVGFGALGDGHTGECARITPVRIMTGTMAVSAGTGHSLFLKKDGTVWGVWV